MKKAADTNDELRAEYRFDYSTAHLNRFAELMTADEEAVVREAIATAKQRDLELTSGQVQGRAHDEVMQAAHRAVGCDGPTTRRRKPAP